MMTMREASRAGLVVLLMLLLAWLGRWLSLNEPDLIMTFRFVNGVVLLFIGVVLLLKWDRVQLDLVAHRAEIAALVIDIHDFLRTREDARDARVEILLQRSVKMASEMAAHANREAQARHDKINERLDALGVPKADG